MPKESKQTKEQSLNRFMKETDRLQEKVGEVLDEENVMVVIAVLVRLLGISAYYDVVHDEESDINTIDEALAFITDGIRAAYRDVERHQKEKGMLQ